MQATPPPPPPPSTPSFKNDNEDEDGVKKKIEIIEQRERTKTIEKLQAQQIGPIQPPLLPPLSPTKTGDSINNNGRYEIPNKPIAIEFLVPIFGTINLPIIVLKFFQNILKTKGSSIIYHQVIRLNTLQELKQWERLVES